MAVQPRRRGRYLDSGESGQPALDALLARAHAAAGTYECLILEMNDTIKFEADGAAVAANAGCADVATIFISTDVASLQAGTIGANANQAVVLTGAITVPGTATLGVR